MLGNAALRLFSQSEGFSAVGRGLTTTAPDPAAAITGAGNPAYAYVS